MFHMLHTRTSPIPVRVCWQVEDVPSIWNQKMKDYLGTAPEDDAKGCLQVRSG